MNLLRQGKTFFHIAGSGHEAIQAGCCYQLDPKKDWLFPYYRDLAWFYAAGITPKEFFLQCFAKADDPSSGGRQLPGHFGHPDLNIPSQSSPTGTQFLNAVGVALASAKKGENAVTYVSSGEGTTSQGEFHEAVNWASREKLPVLFLIENNKYAISVHVNQQSGGKGGSIAEMMCGYENLYITRIDGTDFFDSYDAVKEAVDYIKNGKGPALIEAEVVRLLSHSSSDDQKKYRDPKEIEEDLKKDPIEKFSSRLINEGYITKEEINKIKSGILEEIEKASAEAFKAADPDPRDACRNLFDESGLKDQLEYEESRISW